MNIRHQAFYTFMRFLVAPYYATLGRHHWKTEHPKSKNYILLTNHNTNWDFFYFGLPFPRQMYYVASEHIFRLGFTSRLIIHLVDPIARRKGSDSSDTVEEILKRLSRGDNICMMAEGNRSFSGETGFISPATASLVKKSNAGLITYTIHGGYFMNPRWSTKRRKGPTYGTLVHEYTPEDLQTMTEEEIIAAIRKDLYVNAYEDPLTKGKKYRTENPAENLETALFACPKCGEMGTLSSHGDILSCRKCGLEARYTEEGYLESSDTEFTTVLDWFRWQLSYLNEQADRAEGDLFSDEDVRLTQILPGHENLLLAQGTLRLNRETMSVEGNSFSVQEIGKISVALRGTLLFTMKNGNYYEVKSEKPYAALKYMMAIYRLQGRTYY